MKCFIHADAKQSLITYITDVGELTVESTKDFITHAYFSNYFNGLPYAVIDDSPKIKLALHYLIKSELGQYCNNPKHQFQLPLQIQGSNYQQRIWQALCTIPSGQVLSYGEFARNLNTSARAIGQACKRNHFALFIPCHRIVAKNNLGGYMGKSTALIYKKKLLEHECALFKPHAANA